MARALPGVATMPLAEGADRAAPDSRPDLSPARLLAYGALGMPLAFAALPLYVHVPRLYADHFGLGLAAVGGVLLATRLGDAVIDPLIGRWSDRIGRRRWLLGAALLLLVPGLAGLLAPSLAGQAAPGLMWFGALLVLTHLGYSLATINHAAWGAELASTPHGRTRVTASREGFALLGVILAASLPALLVVSHAEALRELVFLFVALVLLCALTTLGGTRETPYPRAFHGHAMAPSRRSALQPAFRPLLAVFALNGIAAAIPGSLVLFFVADVLRAEAQSGMFLALYFAAGAAGLPGWVWLARRAGRVRAWLAGMALSVLAFVWATLLGAGDTLAFAAICLASGLALGADAALPASLLADVIERDARRGAGDYFGWWSLVTKLNLALAAGISLPLLAWLGYAPGSAEPAALGALAVVYGLVPVALKLAAMGLLWRQRLMLEPGFPMAREDSP